ncbi:MAG TPA: hemolysin family protein [Acidobacteriaceae bacterium]|jgi:CBS domain containing-hemolysin-like protein|nr:hemolysin family protein [Acidobacteriaceae bacterium]
MTYLIFFVMLLLLVVLTLNSYIDRLYFEMGKFLSREFQENIDAWEQRVEPHLGMSRERIALSAGLLTHLSIAALALLFGELLFDRRLFADLPPKGGEIAQALFAIVLVILFFNRFLPQLFFTRTRGLWIVRLTWLLRFLFYLLLPVTVVLGFLLSVAALAEQNKPETEEHPAEAVEALIEAGKEEGILEESDRALIRSAVEFGDKVVREVMTPRPAMFAVSTTTTLANFTEALRTHAYSRVPVYQKSLDDIVGIAFVHDLLQVTDADATHRTVEQIVRPAAFTPETKRVQMLLREMQQDKQHMMIVIDEYGGVAGLVTIEDLLEEIVGTITDEHEIPGGEDTPQHEPDGSVIVPGNFELAHMDALFGQDADLLLSDEYESTTLGGLVTEVAGRIPLAGEVIEMDGLRFEVLASSSRRVERLRLRRLHAPEEPSPA